jgi:hypothetical protein
MRELWDRPSLDMNVRPSKVAPRIGRSDLLVPSGPSKLRMLGLTFVGGVTMALLYVFPPLMIVAIVSSVHLTAQWFWLAIGAAAVAFWATLFVLAVRESAADKVYAEQL